MKKTVLLYSRLPESLQQKLARNFNLLCQPDGIAWQDEKALAQVQGLIGWGGGMAIDAALLAKMPNLEVISTISVGYDHIDMIELNRRGILLAHTPDVLSETVADTIFALLLATARRVVELDAMVRGGQWDGPIGSQWMATDVHHKTMGILGMGRIGQAVARRAGLGFAMPVLYTANQSKTQLEQQCQARKCSLSQVLLNADFVVITLPLTSSTRHMLNRETLALMKPEAILINGARGAIVDEQALVEALRNREIAGAGLDVFEQEPLPADSPLLKMKNVVLMPHAGSATVETRHAMAQMGVDNLIAALNGTIKANLVNPAVLKQIP